MDITTVFGTVVEGSNPPGCTQELEKQCPLEKALWRKNFKQYVDNYVGNVHKGHASQIDFLIIFSKNSL